jgi:hypothetical protein
MKRILLLSLRAVTLCGLLAVCASFEPVLAVTFTVTTVNDSGPGSLRQAILDSNAASTAFNVINFSIGTGAQTISPSSPLPRISNPVTIDGTTQPGYAGKPLIEIEGSQAGSNPGLVISAGFSTIKGLVINRFKSDGIFMYDTNGNTIEGNFIGTDVTGSIDLGNSGDGIFGSSGIGSHVIRGNVISGNGGNGVSVSDGLSNHVEDNFIGTDATGTFALGNDLNGIRASFDSVVARRNVISGNGQDGIFSLGLNLFQGNFIGTDATGTLPIGNAGHGLRATIDQVGGVNDGEGNTIAFNGGSGVVVTRLATVPTTILSNSIFSNGGLGIDIDDDGVTANDACDADSNPFDLQNYPVLTSVSRSGDHTTIEGTLDSTPNSTFTIQFFSNAGCDPSGFGEGQHLIGSITVATGASCATSFVATFPNSSVRGSIFTATATDSNNSTSEFSQCFSTCLPTLTPASISFPGNVGVGTPALSGTVDVQIPAGCNWTAVSNDSFITITGGGSGSGNGTVSYTLAANPSNTTSRSGTITIAGQNFTLLQGPQFLDVPADHPFYTFIGKLAARGVTLGCGGGNYCPESNVTREQMAAFILRARGEFKPPAPASQRFDDVPASNTFYNFIDRMAVLQITLGCSASPPLYCPGDSVTREQMAAFLIRALHEPGYIPPEPPQQRFADVAPTSPFYGHIEEMAVRQITLGCSASPPLYCPSGAVTRAQMAAFLVRAFGL